MPPRRPDPTTLAVFAAVVLAGGLNVVAVRYSNHELAPFWGGALRLLGGAAILGAIAVTRRFHVPRGRALLGIVLYGVLGFAASYALLYWGLVDAPAAAGAVAISLVPLLTLVLAPLHGLERFRLQAIAGAVVSAAGIAIVFADQLRAAVGIVSLVALVLGAAAVAESTIIVKLFPRSQPTVTNALGMAIGAVLLLALSVAGGEPHVIPEQTATLVALGYLVFIGSVFLFMGFLYVLARWTASSASYQLLFMPLITVPAAAFLRSEPVSGAFVAGGALVLVGVYFGAIAAPINLGRRAPAVPLAPAGRPAIAGDATTAFVPPNCP
jgi:drug/metabolite transporter (DMT)-like permease